MWITFLQHDIYWGFSTGKHNLLIATRLHEDLDFSAAMLVVRYGAYVLGILLDTDPEAGTTYLTANSLMPTTRVQTQVLWVVSSIW